MRQTARASPGAEVITKNLNGDLGAVEMRTNHAADELPISRGRVAVKLASSFIQFRVARSGANREEPTCEQCRNLRERPDDKIAAERTLSSLALFGGSLQTDVATITRAFRAPSIAEHSHD